METKFKIIGFSGKLGVGKNYVGEILFGKKLYELGYNVHILAFGDQVKYELGSRLKFIKDDKIITEMNETFEQLFINKTAETRQKLQYYATDYCRNGGNWIINDNFTMINQSNIWIKGLYLQILNIVSRSYTHNEDLFVITDVRFVNEAEFIKSLGGKIIRINAPSRNEKKIVEEAQKNTKCFKDFSNFITKIKRHESETNLDNYTFDYVLDNEPSDINIDDKVDKIINTL